MATNTNVNVTYQAYDRSRTATASFERNMRRVSQSIANIAGVSLGFYGIYRGLSSATEAAVEFEYNMAKVATMLDNQSMKHLPQVEKAIEALSVQYGKSAADLQATTYTILSNQIAVDK